MLRPIRGKVRLLFVSQLRDSIKAILLSINIGTKELVNVDDLHLEEIIYPDPPLKDLVSTSILRPIELVREVASQCLFRIICPLLLHRLMLFHFVLIVEAPVAEYV